MAAYALIADINTIHGSDLLLRIADRDGNETVDTDAVNLALESASSEIDSYIGTRYDVPLPTPTQMVKQVCIDIAVYRLALSATALTDEMRKRYEDATAWLKAVSKGEAAILPPDGSGNGDEEDEDGTDEVGVQHSAGFFYSTRG